MKKDLLLNRVEVNGANAQKPREKGPVKPPFFCLENENPSGVSERTSEKRTLGQGDGTCREVSYHAEGQK
jgi:hypothetical protein